VDRARTGQRWGSVSNEVHASSLWVEGTTPVLNAAQLIGDIKGLPAHPTFYPRITRWPNVTLPPVALGN
jgi:hypothetical protein